MAAAVWRGMGTLARVLSLDGLHIQGYDAGWAFEIGEFMVKPHLIDHSAFYACGLEVSARGKYVNYRGDFRRHGRQGDRFDHFLANPPEGVDALLMEGMTPQP
ncbi:MAG: hypothetical protein HYZ13_16895 [Acidobacteria bacterium]|nr:hypothetical protein [Acidobacteriota bacterium]